MHTSNPTAPAAFLSALAIAQAASWAQAAAPDAPAPDAAALPPAVLSEVRAYGPLGAEDSFVEVSSTGDEDLDLSGWTLQFLDRAGQLVTVPLAPTTTLPPRGHLLLAGEHYSLGAYAKPDATIPLRIAGGVRLCNAAGEVVDAVGPGDPESPPPAPSGATAPKAAGKASKAAGFREGTGLPAWAFAPGAASTWAGSGLLSAGQIPQFSCVRRQEAGRLAGAWRDSNDNGRDWLIVSVSGALGGHKARLGAPGPQNQGSSRLAIAPRAPQDKPQDKPQTVASGSEERAPDGSGRLAPLREREAGANASLGTLTLRYRLVNASARPLKKFRLRVVGTTSGESPDGIADVRLLPSPKSPPTAGARDGKAASTWGAPASAQAGAPIFYGALDEPPAQASGGGLNSSLTFEALGPGVAPGGSAELRVLLGVEKLGRYRLALDGGGLSLVFNGQILPDRVKSQASQAWPSGSASRQASRATNGASGQSQSTNGASAQAGAPAETGKPGEESPILAAIILEGNTEDAVAGSPGAEGTADAESPVGSPLVISASEVVGATGGIRLRFSGPIDAGSVAGALFTITVNGQQVVGSATPAGTGSVLLALAEGALDHGDRVSVRWDKLLDAEGRRIQGQAGPIIVP